MLFTEMSPSKGFTNPLEEKYDELSRANRQVKSTFLQLMLEHAESLGQWGFTHQMLIPNTHDNRSPNLSNILSMGTVGDYKFSTLMAPPK